MKKMRNVFRRPTVIVALVLVLATLLCFAGCSKAADPKEAVKGAAKATIAEFAELNSQFGYDEISKMSATGNCYQEMGLYLKDANVGMDLSPFYGSGMTLYANSSMAERKMDMSMDFRLADYDCLNFYTFFDDSMLYMACKEILGDTLFGVDTMTMAEDMPDAGLEAGFGYNIFDLVEDYINENGQFALAAETKKALIDAATAMTDGSTWAAGDKHSITSGSESAECDTYSLTIPEKVFADFVAAAFEAMANDDYFRMMFESAAMYEIEEAGSYEAFVTEMIESIADELNNSITEPIVTKFYVSGGKLCGIDMDLTIEDVNSETSMRFGIEEPANYFEMTFEVNDGSSNVELKLVSQGDHVLKDGKFTDKMSLEVLEDGVTLVEMNMDSDYDTKSGDYAVDMDIEIEGVVIVIGMDGNVAIDGTTMDMTFDNIAVSAAGFDVTLDGFMHISEGTVPEMASGDILLFKDITDDELYDLSVLAQENAYALLMTLMEEVPAIMNLFV